MKTKEEILVKIDELNKEIDKSMIMMQKARENSSGEEHLKMLAYYYSDLFGQREMLKWILYGNKS